MQCLRRSILTSYYMNPTLMSQRLDGIRAGAFSNQLL
jgi:hypothetical protein